MNKAPDCAVILSVRSANPERLSWLEPLLQSVQPRFEFVIASHLEMGSELKRFFSAFGHSPHWIKTGGDSDSSEWKNAAADKTDAPSLLFVPHWVAEPSPLLKLCDEGSKNGSLTGGLILSRENTILHAGLASDSSRQWHYLFRNAPRTHRLAQIPREVPAIADSPFFVPAKLFKEIGGFDPNLSGEDADLDLCLKVRLDALKKVHFAPSAIFRRTSLLPQLGWLASPTDALSRKWDDKPEECLREAAYGFAQQDESRAADVQEEFRLTNATLAVQKEKLKTRRVEESWNFRVGASILQVPKATILPIRQRLIDAKARLNIRYFLKDSVLPRETLADRDEIAAHKGAALAATGRYDSGRVILFSQFDARSELRPYARYLIEKLAGDIDADFLWISTSPEIKDVMKMISHPRCLGVVHRANVGLDFNSWKSGLRFLKENGIKPEKLHSLILANDSCFGPLFDLSPFVEEIESASQASLGGITENFDVARHLQSYFLSFNRAAIQNPFFDRFWDSVGPTLSKNQVIHEYEIGLSESAREAGVSVKPFVGSDALRPFIEWEPDHPYAHLPNANPSVLHWDVLIKNRLSPFLKKSVFAKTSAEKIPGYPSWREKMASYSEYPASLIDDYASLKS